MARRAMACMALLAFLCKALLVTGWMPVVADDGSWQIVPCSGTGPIDLTGSQAQQTAESGDHHHHHHQAADPADAPASHDHGPSAAHDACTFAVLAALGGPVSDAATGATVVTGDRLALPEPAGRFFPPTSIAVTLPPAQGPPVRS